MKKSLYIFSNGRFKRKHNTLFFDNEQGRKYIPVEDINEIMIFGEVDINKKLLDFVSQKKILIHFFNYYGYYSGSYYPREHLNSGYITLKQAEFYLDKQKRRELASLFVKGSANNMLQVLKYYDNRGRDLKLQIEQINELIESIEKCEDVSELMALEGNIKNIYFSGFNQIIQDPEFRFYKRTRRPPRDSINALMSFGNSVFYTQILSEIYKTHLDPRIGYLHSTNFRRFTLNLDIADIFKPVIIDRILFTLIGRNMISKKDFQEQMDGVFLKEKVQKLFISELDKKLKTTFKHKKLKRNVSYRRLLRLELYKLEKHLIEEKRFIPFESKW